MRKSNETVKKLKNKVIVVLLLFICFCIVTFALVYSTVFVKDNQFQTGKIKINLNDGKPIIEEDEYLFEPGMKVEKEFFIQNQSSCDVYYRLYLVGIEGELADELNITVSQEDVVLFDGKAADFTKEYVNFADDILKMDERKMFKIKFYFPKEAGNKAQKLDMSFALKADAVQTKNNPQKLFVEP